jgi:hypothetical protein
VQGGEVVFDDSRGHTINEAVIIRHDSATNTLYLLETDIDARGRFRASLSDNGNYFLVNIVEFFEHINIDIDAALAGDFAQPSAAQQAVPYISQTSMELVSGIIDRANSAFADATPRIHNEAEPTVLPMGRIILDSAPGGTDFQPTAAESLDIIFMLDTSTAMDGILEDALLTMVGAIESLVADPNVDFRFAICLFGGLRDYAGTIFFPLGQSQGVWGTTVAHLRDILYYLSNRCCQVVLSKYF